MKFKKEFFLIFYFLYLKTSSISCVPDWKEDKSVSTNHDETSQTSSSCFLHHSLFLLNAAHENTCPMVQMHDDVRKNQHSREPHDILHTTNSSNQDTVRSRLLTLTKQNLSDTLHQEWNRKNRENSSGASRMRTPSSSPLLILVMIYSNKCPYSYELIQTMEKASNLFTSKVKSWKLPSQEPTLDISSDWMNVHHPLFATLSIEDTPSSSHHHPKNDDKSHDTKKSAFSLDFDLNPKDLSWLHHFQLNENDSSPSFKLLLVEDNEDNGTRKIEHEYDNWASTHDHPKTNIQVKCMDIIGATHTAQDIVNGVFHYMSRLVLSHFMNSQPHDHASDLQEDAHENLMVDTDDLGESKIDHPDVQGKDHDDNLLDDLFASKYSVFTITTKNDFELLLKGFGPYIYHEVSQDLPAVSENERAYIQDLLNIEHNYLKDPFLAFIQCRIKSSTNSTENENSTSGTDYTEFEELAEIYIHRRDVAFFILPTKDPSECEWLWTNSTEENMQHTWNGAIRVVRIVSHILLNQSESTIPRWSLGAAYRPSSSSSLHRNELRMRQYIVIQSTPSVLWFDRFTSAILSFPFYRKIHMVLFLDFHSPSFLKDENELMTVLNRSQHAISLFRQAALHVRETRLDEDVVFLIVPSTEIRVMRTFGIDIWTPMDDIMQGAGSRNVSETLSNILPVAMITSQKESLYYMKRYYLGPKAMLNTVCDNESLLHKQEKASLHSLGSIGSFMADFFEGKLKHTIKSQSAPFNQTNESGVAILTGHGFEGLMMNRSKHSLIQFYSPSCGHSKRFSVTWNKLARLVRYLKIDSLIDIMKIDVTENDVLHPSINLSYVPSVYYFSPTSNRPIELKTIKTEDSKENTIERITDPSLIIDWFVTYGEVDKDELLNLLST